MHDKSKEYRVGAVVDSSEIKCFQVNSSRLKVFSTDLVLSEHILTNSFRNRIPTFLTMYLLVVGFFNASVARVLLLLLATAFPMCRLLGVSEYFRVPHA